MIEYCKYHRTHHDCPLVVPVVNNNGNSADSLIESAMDIRNDLLTTINSLCKSDLAHGRNFQTAKPGQYEQFRKQHLERIKILQDMADDMYAIGMRIQEQHK